MYEFLFWRKNKEGKYLVNHSRYWSDYDIMNGKECNQHLLACLLADRDLYTSQIINNKFKEEVYEKFLDCMKLEVTELSIEGDISVRFTVLEKLELDKWIENIKNFNLIKDEIKNDSNNKDIEKASWFSFFKISSK